MCFDRKLQCRNEKHRHRAAEAALMASKDRINAMEAEKKAAQKTEKKVS